MGSSQGAQGQGPGVVKPVPHSLPNVANHMFAQMVGQLGRLTQLAAEVEGLKEENVALVSAPCNASGSHHLL